MHQDEVLENTVSPIGVANLVSAGTPFFASVSLIIIESMAKSIFEDGAAIIKNASF